MQAKPLNGFDYVNQAWVVNGVYVCLMHDVPCACRIGKVNAGESVKLNAEVH